MPKEVAEVLVVDDDIGALDALTDLLDSDGYAVAQARSGREAMTYLRGNPLPRLIILDLLMPEMDGWQFLEERKKDGKLAAIPVVVLTALGPGVTVDANAVLYKPLNVERFLRTVREYC